MERYSYGNLLKSNLIFMGLLFSFVAMASRCDTLIIDGKVVVVDKEVTYHQNQEPPILDPIVEKPKREKMEISLRAGLQSGLALGAVKSTSNYQTIDSFTQDPNNWSPSIGAHIFAYVERPKLTLEAGIEVDYWQSSLSTFDNTSLDESFISFVSEDKGELRQEFYSVFSPPFFETDTVAISLQDASIKTLSSSIVVGANYLSNEREDIALYGGLHIGLTLLSTNMEDDIVLINDQIDPVVQRVTAQKDNQIGAQLSAEFGVLLRERRKARWRLGTQVRAFSSAIPLRSPLEHRPFIVGLSASIFI